MLTVRLIKLQGTVGNAILFTNKALTKIGWGKEDRRGIRMEESTWDIADFKKDRKASRNVAEAVAIWILGRKATKDDVVEVKKEIDRMIETSNVA